MACFSPALDGAIAAALGSGPIRRKAVAGGCIHQSWMLSLADGRRVFCKRNSAGALANFQAEATGLRALVQAGSGLAIPAPLWCGAVGSDALLILEWLDLGGGGRDGWSALGRGLAALHRHPVGERFGWQEDNFIGSGPQRNGWLEDWGAFFAGRRIAHQLAIARRRGLELRGGDQLVEAIPYLLAGHTTRPSLVHGDLWSGNAAITAEGLGSIFDPAAHLADREVDLAMTHLFGGFPAAFHDAYAASWPLPAGHQGRRDLYNLFHLLNHANLFGGGYRQQSQQLIDQLLA
ncbi:MAG: fructosamine kinase [Aphanocapsa feldmannii 288cV]|nr:MAG: fructosamine kinase [Aphanocapsa feldmannii 288cV]